MRNYKSFIFLVFFSMVLSVSHADSSSPISARDLIIQREMGCIDQSSRDHVNWGELCNQREIVSPPPVEEIPIKAVPISGFKQKTHSFSIANQTFFDKFSKYKLENNTGLWEAIEGKYVYRPAQGNIFNNMFLNFYSLEGMYGWGKNTKKTYSDPDLITVKNIKGAMYEARALVGKDLNLAHNLRITPYAGYGVRYKTNKGGGHQNTLSDSTLVVGHDSSTLTHYIPAGLTTTFITRNGYEITLNMEYDFLIRGRIKHHYTDVEGPLSEANGFPFYFDDVRVTQRGGYGLRTSLKLLKHFSNFDVYLEPFARFWKMKASKTGEGDIFIDPGSTGSASYYDTGITQDEKNYTLEAGLKTGLHF